MSYSLHTPAAVFKLAWRSFISDLTVPWICEVAPEVQSVQIVVNVAVSGPLDRIDPLRHVVLPGYLPPGPADVSPRGACRAHVHEVSESSDWKGKVVNVMPRKSMNRSQSSLRNRFLHSS